MSDQERTVYVQPPACHRCGLEFLPDEPRQQLGTRYIHLSGESGCLHALGREVEMLKGIIVAMATGVDPARLPDDTQP